MTANAVLAEMRDAAGSPLGSFATYLHTDTVRGVYISPAYRFTASSAMVGGAVYVCADDGATLIRFPFSGALAAGDSITFGIPTDEQKAEWEAAGAAHDPELKIQRNEMTVAELMAVLSRHKPYETVSVCGDYGYEATLSVGSETVLG